MRAKILARFFVESHPHTLAERIVGANKMCPASWAHFVLSFIR